MKNLTFHSNQIADSAKKTEMQKYVGQDVHGNNTSNGQDFVGRLERIEDDRFVVIDKATGVEMGTDQITPVESEADKNPKDPNTDQYLDKRQTAKDRTLNQEVVGENKPPTEPKKPEVKENLNKNEKGVGLVEEEKQLKPSDSVAVPQTGEDKKPSKK